MTPEQINIAIAEALGAKWLLLTFEKRPESWFIPHQQVSNYKPECLTEKGEWQGNIMGGKIPSYYSDLNACHEMEACMITIDPNGDLEDVYENALVEAMRPSRWPIWYATAKHRSEAFLRAIETWRGS